MAHIIWESTELFSKYSKGKLVINPGDGNQAKNEIIFENYYGHYITYDYCPPDSIEWSVSDPMLAPIYPVCTQSCCDMLIVSRFDQVFDDYIDDYLFYDGEYQMYNDKEGYWEDSYATYKSFYYPNDVIFYNPQFQFPFT